MNKTTGQFIKKRNAVLRSMDVEELKHLSINPPTRFTDEIILAGGHKARLALSTFTEQEKDVSRAWLKEHGFKGFMGEEL